MPIRYIILLLLTKTCVFATNTNADTVGAGISETISFGREDTSGPAIVFRYEDVFGKQTPFSGRYHQLYLKQGATAKETCLEIANETDPDKKQKLEASLKYLPRDAGFADINTFCKVFPYPSKFGTFGAIKINPDLGITSIDENLVGMTRMNADFAYGILAGPSKPCSPTLQAKMTGRSQVQLDPNDQSPVSVSDLHVLAGGQIGFVCSNSDGTRYIIYAMGAGKSVDDPRVGGQSFEDLINNEIFANASVGLGKYLNLNGDVSLFTPNDSMNNVIRIGGGAKARLSSDTPIYLVPTGFVELPKGQKANGALTIGIIWVPGK